MHHMVTTVGAITRQHRLFPLRAYSPFLHLTKHRFSTSSSSSSSSSSHNRIVSIDRSNLVSPSIPVTSSTTTSSNPLLQELLRSIDLRGPLTVAEYMSTALGHPRHGYYKCRPVFGEAGDFTTSPEISQVFGELIGVWCVAQWQALGRPKKLRIVELGPGRGTLMSDLLRACSRFGEFIGALEGGGLRLVETSPALAAAQAEKLVGREEVEFEQDSFSMARMPKRGKVKGMEGVEVEWLMQFQAEKDTEVPVLVIAQELFDALPVHQFEVADDGSWRERLVDVNFAESEDEEAYALATKEKERLDLRFVLSKGATPASKVLIPSQFAPRTKADQALYEQPNPGDRLEVSAAAAALMQDITRRIAATSGACLVIDYGSNAPGGDTLRGIKEHRFVHPLSEPGKVDLSVDVDFSLLKRISEAEGVDGLMVDGPIPQGEFLRNLGIEYRMSSLLQRTPDEKTQFELFDAYQRLVESEEVVNGGMGLSYKVLSLTSSNQRDLDAPAPGFVPPH